MKQKLYPFSATKHAHDIEYYHNYLYNTMRDMEDGEIEMDDARYDKICDLYYGKLQELYEIICGGCYGGVAYLTGEQIGLAKKIVAWAKERRAGHLIAAGKTHYLQYV